ncbi:MAG: hypothetical protein HC918_00870 [Oscillatoriales cyanobacterium SM2_1_8]|nr:hypothetical protein [Oscillatoriales cyanobacterium SM2_1_8]
MNDDRNHLNPTHNHRDRPSIPADPTDEVPTDTELADTELDERFWLLSLYLDGEATPTERRQVEAWIDGDRGLSQMYRQQRRLQQSLVEWPAPATDATTFWQGLNARLDRHDRRRGLGWPAAALATVAGLVAVMAWPRSPQVQLAQPAPPEERLILAMEQPLVPVPQNTFDR